MRQAVAVLVAGAIVAACDDTTGPVDASTLHATVSGAVAAEYSGSSGFSAGLPHLSVTFVVSSNGIGDSANQGFLFEAASVLAAGDYEIGELGPSHVRVSYWYDEGGSRNLFFMDSGALLVESSTASATRQGLSGRIQASFAGTARLRFVCDITQAGPGSVQLCAAPDAAKAIQLSGWFNAGPQRIREPGLPLFR